MYNFDEPFDRYKTGSLKFDFKKEHEQPEDVLPMWVADMDYPVLPDITEAIIKRAKHPVYGYTLCGDDYYKSVMNWMQHRHGYETKKEWYITTPGVVFAIAMAIRAFTKPGDAVMINTPVYYPFSSAILKNDRKLITSSLLYKEEKIGRYEMNFAEIEERIIKNKVKLFILCSPHNPVGRVWSSEELIEIGAILKKHKVLLISDEIHMDFVYTGYRHHVFAGLRKEYEDFTITCTAPSKTFNLAGLQISNIIIANKTLREQFALEVSKTGYDEPNLYGLIACQTAYNYGAEYVDEMLTYLEGNIQFAEEYLKKYLPKVKVTKMEGTYLMWLNFNEYGLTTEELNHRITHQAKLWLDPGEIFGIEGEGFQRINIAVPRSTLVTCLEHLKKAFRI